MKRMPRLLWVLSLVCSTLVFSGAYTSTSEAGFGFCALYEECVYYCDVYCTELHCNPTSYGWDCRPPYQAAYDQCHYECYYPECCIN